MRQIRTVPIKSDYKHKIHNHIIKAGYLARFFIIRQIKLKYVPHFHLFFIYIFVIINVVFVHKSKTWKIRFLCRCTKYQQNAKLTSNQTPHFRSFCVIYIGRFLAVLINIQVIRHKSKANSHQNYPQCHTLLSANIHIHGRCKKSHTENTYSVWLIFYLFSEIIATASDMQSFDYLINDRVFKHER